MKAERLASGNYRARVTYTENGKRETESFTAQTEADALYLAAEFKKFRKRVVRSELTVGEAIDRYLENRDSVLSPSTINAHKRYRKLYLQDIMNVQLDDLTTEQVQRAVNEEAKKHSPKTIKNAHGLLTAALSVYKPGLTLDTVFPQKKKAEINIPTTEQVNRLLEHATEPDLKVAITLAATLGLRRSEICALTRKDVDVKNNTIRINKAVVLGEDGEWHTKLPKTEAGTRTLQTSPDMIKMLLALPDTQETILSWHPNRISYRFDDIKVKAGVNCRFHDLRHYNASVMLALGVPDKYAMERIGHATPNMLKTVYQHIMDDKRNEVTASVNNFFESNLCHKTCHTQEDSR